MVDTAFASSTKATYTHASRDFDAFRAAHGIPLVWPADPNHVIQYAAFLSLENRSYSTARTYITALSTLHRLRGWEDPTNNFLLQKLMTGFGRSKSQVDSRLPITFDKLRQLIDCLHTVCDNTFEHDLFRAAFTLAFFGFFRISELVGQVKHGKTVTDGLRVDDVQLGSVLNIRLRKSKTDQQGAGTSIRLKAVDSAPEVCPVRALVQYMSLRPKNGDKLLIHHNGESLTRYQFQAVLKKAACLLKWDATRFSSHSFRIGAATTAASNGHSIESIMRKGRWRSAAVTSYIRR